MKSLERAGMLAGGPRSAPVATSGLGI